MARSAHLFQHHRRATNTGRPHTPIAGGFSRSLAGQSCGSDIEHWMQKGAAASCRCGVKTSLKGPHPAPSNHRFRPNFRHEAPATALLYYSNIQYTLAAQRAVPFPWQHEATFRTLRAVCRRRHVDRRRPSLTLSPRVYQPNTVEAIHHSKSDNGKAEVQPYNGRGRCFAAITPHHVAKGEKSAGVAYLEDHADVDGSALGRAWVTKVMGASLLPIVAPAAI